MPTALHMPKLSPTMEEGQIAAWHKKEGDFVEVGDVLMEVATDKATIEHTAIDPGYLRKILVKEGQTAQVNDPIAIFTEDKKESIDGFEVEKPKETVQEEEKAPEKETPAASPSKTSTFQQPAFVPAPPLEHTSFPYPTEKRTGRIVASPLARKIAEQEGLDLSTVKGSGPGGRIIKEDLALAQKGGVVTFGHRGSLEQAPGSYEEIPLTPMRKAIGKRLQQAKTFIPHYYVTIDVNAGQLFTVREELKVGNVKLTYNDFVLRATALALRDMPEINRGYNSENEAIIQFQTVDISLAVSVEDGLITPIIRYADHKNLGELSAEAKALSLKARDGKLQEYEYKGGSFTVSNLGMFGIREFQAVINPPQAAILAVGGLRDEPIIENGQVVPGKKMALSLSSDHRVIDGAEAAKFLKKVEHYLEHPSLLLV